MALRMFEGFDVTAPGYIAAKTCAQTGITGSDLHATFGSATTVSGCAFGTGKCMLLQPYAGDAYFNIVLDNQPTYYLCFHYKSGNQTATVGIRDGGTYQCYLGNDGAGHMALYNNAGTIISGFDGTRTAFDSNWHYIEWAITIHNTTGSSILYVDGVLQWNVTNANTRTGTTNNYGNNIYFAGTGAWSSVNYFDNIVVMDGTGSDFNGFQTEMRVVPLMPTASGTYAQFTPSAGSNYACVNQIPDDGDTTYVYSQTVNAMESYVFSSIPPPGILKSVLVSGIARKDDVSGRIMSFTARKSSTDYVASGLNTLTSSYQPFTYRWDGNDPAGTAWTLANLNAMEFGVKLIS